MEVDLDLFDLRIGGKAVWERVRYRLFKRALERTGVYDESQTRNTTGSAIWGNAERLKLWGTNIIRANPFFAGSHDFVYFGHQRRKRRENGSWEDIYFDPIHEETDQDYIHLEADYGGRHFSPAATDNLRYLDLITYTGSIARKLRLSRVRLSTMEQQMLGRIEDELSSRLCELDVESTVRNALAVRKSTISLYERVLERIEPDLAIVVNSSWRKTFIEACHNRSIPVVEFQYGGLINNEFQLGYNIPRSATTDTYPDYIFVWGDFWSGAEYLPISKHNVFVTGYPYLEREKDRLSEATAKDQAIFISQGTIARELAKMAAEVATEVPDWNVVYKVHPGDFGRWREKHPCLVDSPVTVLEDERPLHRLFAESRVQVGVSSTALYEGMAFDLCTFLVPLPGIEYSSPLLQKDYATLVSGADDLREKLSSRRIQPVDNDLFASNSLERFETAIQSILRVDDLPATG